MGMGYGLMVECLIPMYKALELITTLFKNKHTQSLITAFEKQRQGDLSEFKVSAIVRPCLQNLKQQSRQTNKKVEFSIEHPFITLTSLSLICNDFCCCTIAVK